MAINQVQQREQENPDHVDEVPVKAADVDRGHVLSGKAAGLRLENQDEEDTHADHHVEGVQSRHRKIKREEELRMALLFELQPFQMEGRTGNVMLVELFLPLERLHAQEDAA